MATSGYPPILLCPARIRLAVRRFTELSLASLVVVAYSEVGSNVEVQSVETIAGAEG